MNDNNIPSKVSDFFAGYPLRVFNKRQLIIRPGERMPGVFFIVEGRVGQYDITATGNEIVVNMFKPGAFFPMSMALNDTPSGYFFEASTVVKARSAPPEAVVQFLTDNPDVALDLLRRVYRGTDGMLRRMAHLMGGDARHRLLFEILNVAYRFGEVQEDGQLFVPFTEGDIAKQSGLTRETVSRNIAALKLAGLVKVVRGGIMVADARKLESMLD